MIQTPTFKCLKKCSLHNCVKWDIIKMSFESLKECDEKHEWWRDKFVELSLDEELKFIK